MKKIFALLLLSSFYGLLLGTDQSERQEEATLNSDVEDDGLSSSMISLAMGLHSANASQFGSPKQKTTKVPGTVVVTACLEEQKEEEKQKEKQKEKNQQHYGVMNYSIPTKIQSYANHDSAFLIESIESDKIVIGAKNLIGAKYCLTAVIQGEEGPTRSYYDEFGNLLGRVAHSGGIPDAAIDEEFSEYVFVDKI